MLALFSVVGGVAGVVSMGGGPLEGWFSGTLLLVVGGGGEGNVGTSSIIGLGAFFEDTLDFLDARRPFPLLLPAECIELRSGLEALLLVRGVKASRSLRPFDVPTAALPEFDSTSVIVLARLEEFNLSEGESKFVNDPLLDPL